MCSLGIESLVLVEFRDCDLRRPCVVQDLVCVWHLVRSCNLTGGKITFLYWAPVLGGAGVCVEKATIVSYYYYHK